MRRPNPWIAVPSLLAGVIAGAVGWIVTSVSCTAEIRPGVAGDACPVWASIWALVGFVGGTIGMAIVVVLAFRSLAEYREAQEQGSDPPGVGCEVPEDD